MEGRRHLPEVAAGPARQDPESGAGKVTSTPRIVSVETGLPRHYYEQDELLAALRQLWSQRYFNLDRLEQFHRNMRVGGRFLALPKERYPVGFGEANQAFVEVALELGESIVRRLLERHQLAPQSISQLCFTTVTGLAVPSLEARLMNRIPFSPALKRVPLFGLGCLAGAAGIARVADYLVGHPEEAAILLAVELCSLTLQPDDLSVPNLVSSGLFGDGAAAVLMVGADHPLAGPQVLATRSIFFPDSEKVMGWEIGESGFKIVLSSEVPAYAERLGPFLGEFLSEQGLRADQVAAWIAHPGGPKVIDAMESSLNLKAGALERTRESLRRVGNLSSASVLFILKDWLAAPPPPGSYGVVLAMGPAFCAEAVLIRW